MKSDRDLHPASVAAWRRMSFQEKYDLFMAHQEMVYGLKIAAVRSAHPEWSAEDVEAEVARQYMTARPT